MTASLLSQHLGWQYQFVEHSSGVGVLDKSMAVLEAVRSGARTLADLTTATGLSRATAHRLAVALEVHRLLRRDRTGRWLLGPRLGELAGGPSTDALLERAGPVLARLRDGTGESAQLYRRQGDARVCVAAAERRSGLRDTVPVGSVLPMTAGSAAQVLLAWSPDDDLPEDAAFSPRTLAEVRRRGWAASVGEREAGVASVSAPVRGSDGAVLAAVSVSGPIERLTRQPGRLHAAAVLAAATDLAG
jgi:DNA-binding IclR family transcriptional regulator